MEKYLTYNKYFNLVKSFGRQRFDLFSYKFGNNFVIARAWDLITPDHVFNGIAIEHVIDNGIIILPCYQESDFILRKNKNIILSDLNDNDLFAENIHRISCATRNSEDTSIESCRQIVDEWKKRGKILYYTDAHRFYVQNC